MARGLGVPATRAAVARRIGLPVTRRIGLPVSRRIGLPVSLLVIAVVVAACAARVPAAPPVPGTAATPQPPVPSGAHVLAGAGDIADCGGTGDEATAALLDGLEGLVFAAGDNAYPHGTATDFERCYGPSWGRHRERTLPVAGNHEYDVPGAAGHRDYFGAAAAPDGATWYARDVGPWRVIVLDSNCEHVGGCDEDSPQGRWLRAELRDNPAACTLAIWHHPRFSSGWHGGERRTASFWRALQEARAEFVVSAHDHQYERFAPQDADGRRDEAGLRQFVVGTGGGELRGVGRPRGNSEVVVERTHGILRLDLWSGGYAWTFLPVSGAAADTGRGICR